MNYFVFHVSDQSRYGIQKTGIEIFNDLVKSKLVWGFGQHTANRKAIQPGDKVLFYLTGLNNQVFLGAATLKSGAYTDEAHQSDSWFLDKDMLRIDLEDIIVFDEPKPRQSFISLQWRPAQGGSSKISERDFMTVMGAVPDKVQIISEVESEMAFALEKYLEEFIVDNWDKIDFGEKLKLFVDKDGNTGQQYFTEEVGYIDILAQDKDDNFVVIELKKGRKNDEVIGQVLRYMGWVRNNLLKNNQTVLGLIIVGDKDPKLEYALGEISDKVQIKLYSINFKLQDYR